MSKAWKALEKKTAEALGGERISRADDWGRSDYDVHVPEHPYLKVDCKYRKGGWAHHSVLDEIRDKYCKEKGDIAIMVSKSGRKRGEVVSLSLQDFAKLLQMTEALESLIRVFNLTSWTGKLRLEAFGELPEWLKGMIADDFSILPEEEPEPFRLTVGDEFAFKIAGDIDD